MESHISDIVLSQRGRDAGRTFLVVGEEGEYLLLADGRGRRAEHPKRKKRRHTAHQGTADDWVRERLLAAGRLTNSDIRKALAFWAGDPY